jgi:hypothetical protein
MCPPFGFLVQGFSYAFFVVKNWRLYVNFSIPPLWRLMHY